MITFRNQELDIIVIARKCLYIKHLLAVTIYKKFQKTNYTNMIAYLSVKVKLNNPYTIRLILLAHNMG